MSPLVLFSAASSTTSGSMTEIKDKLCSFTDEFSALPLNIYSYSGRTGGRAGGLARQLETQGGGGGGGPLALLLAVRNLLPCRHAAALGLNARGAWGGATAAVLLRLAA
jgi:hypothetical protein